MPQPQYITSKSVQNPATARTPNQKEFACPTLPQRETLQGNVTEFMADNDPLHLSVGLFLRDSFFCALLFTQPSSLSCAPVAHWDAFGHGSSRCISWYQM